MTRRFALLLLTCTALPLGAAEGPTPKTVRLLTVGNSFSHNATHYLGDLAKAAGDTLVLRELIVGGASMELHWGKAQAFEKNAKDKQGLYAAGRSLRQELQTGTWDVVTIQQASIKSHDPTTYRPFARQLRDYIKQHSPQSEVVLHETWEYRIDDPRFSSKSPKPGEPRTQDEMYEGLAKSYRATAKELGVRLIPVGDAFHIVNRDARWGYRTPASPFNAKAAKPNELPDQSNSLNVGWNWKKLANGKTQLGMDGHHANLAGEYLGACVWYEVLFGKSVQGNTFLPKGLDAEHARFLQSTAHRVVQAQQTASE